MLKIFPLAYPFSCVSFLFVFSFAMITILVGADGGIFESRFDGGEQQPSCVMLMVALRSSFKALGAFVFLALGATSFVKLFNLSGFMFGLRHGSFA